MGGESNSLPELEWTGERYVPSVKGEIRLEHVHRYLIARELSHGKRVLDIASGEGYGSDILASVATEVVGVDVSERDRKSTRLNSSHFVPSRMPSSA